MTQQPSAAADSVVVALDVGGTGIKCALVDPAGQVRHTARYPTDRERGPDAVIASVLEHAAHLVDHARTTGDTPVAVGVVVPGVVDEAAGMAHWSANLGLRDVPLRELMTNRLGLPVRLGHDVRAAAVAEARLGAGGGSQRMLFIAIGTGIAAGYVAGGRVDPGAQGASGEIGHVAVRFGSQAPPCGCGAHGCLESVASTAAIALHDPELVVLGGGLAEAGAALLEPLAAALAQRRTFHRLARAELGEGAGCLGAALLALEAVR